MNKMYSMRSVPLCLLGILLALFSMNTLLYSQQATGIIKGTVSDAVTGEALVGANVYFPSLNIGSSTDINGIFSINNVPAGDFSIIARYVGYEEWSSDVSVSDGQTLSLEIELQPTAVEMEELVVTGVGSATEKKKLTSSIETLNRDEIKRAPVESVEQLLQGRITGLGAFNSSGMPGTSGRISTRGIKSTTNSGAPVVYVDNVRVDNAEAFRLALDTGGAESSALSDLVIGEIDRIEVIKGGAASTIYGSDAANGVIQIFTKKGVPGDARWSFNLTSGYDQPVTDFIVEDFTRDHVVQTGSYQSYSVGVSGGNQLFTYNVSGKTFQNNGVITDNLARQRNYSLASGFRVHLSEQSNLEISASYIKNQISRVYNNNLPFSPYSGFEDGSKGDQLGFTEADRLEILELMKTADIKDDIDRFRIAANYDYTPVKGFTNRFTFGVDYRNNEARDFVPKKSGYFFFTENGYLYRSDREYMTITMAYNGTYELPKLGPVEQKLNFGAQGFRVEDREQYSTGEDFSIPGTEDFDNASRITALESNRQLFSGGIYLVDQIAVWDKVFLDAGLRVDGNSTFGDAIGMQFYPKAGIAYLISEEDFYSDGLKNIVSTLKLRTSWGVTGNFPAPFTRDRTYGSQGFLNRSGIAFNNPGNDELKPEKTSSIEAGFEMGLLHDRASIEFNYFVQNTVDALFLVPQDPASGFDNQLMNVGEIENKGIELSIFARIVQAKDFALSANISFATLDNKVVSLGGAAPFSISGFTFLPRRVEEGHPVGTFRVNTPVPDADGNYTGDFVTELVGSPMPKQFGSVSLSITLFKDLTISALTEYAFGHKMVNLKKTLRYFNGTEDAADVIPDGYNWQSASALWLEDADWIKLREIAVSYRVPTDWFAGLTLSASVRNVAMFGIEAENDPELNGYQPSGANTGGYGYIDVSAPRQYRLGVTLDI